MGMVGSFIPVKTEAIEQFKADAHLLDEFLEAGWENNNNVPNDSVDVDKAWHCIHFMLNGTVEGGAEPLAWAVLGGEECGEDAGYGAPRLLTAQQVQSIAAALIGEDEFASRYDPAAMQSANIYLSNMCMRDGAAALKYIVEHYRILVTFYRAAAQRGDGAILLLC